MIRRFDEPIRPDIRYRDRPGAYGVLQRGQKLLITFQSEPDAEFQLPGGGIDPGETPLVALHREVREETGWRIAPLRRLGAYQRYTYMPEYDLWARKICHIFLARPSRPVGEPSEPDHSSLWVTPDEACEMLANSGDRHFVRLLSRL